MLNLKRMRKRHHLFVVGLSEFHDRLKILHTLLCTEERVSISVGGRLLSDSDNVVDMIEKAKIVVGDLHAVLYIKENRVLWYHASFLDFIFAQERSRFKVPVVSSAMAGSGLLLLCLLLLLLIQGFKSSNLSLQDLMLHCKTPQILAYVKLFKK